MFVSPSCAGLLGEVPGYTWAPDRLGGFHDRPIDENDDACDALRYAVMAHEPDPDNPWASLTNAGGVA
jgi:phage terminase large subunit